MTCTHTQREPDRWVETNCFGEDDPHWEYGQEVSTTVDIDTGRYKCTQCGEVMYYTGTWRKHWEGK